MKRQMQAWLHGLIAGLISAVGDTGSVVIGGLIFAPTLLQENEFWKALAGPIVFSSMKTVFAYLKQSPLPSWSTDDTVVVVQSGTVGETTVTSVTTTAPADPPTQGG